MSILTALHLDEPASLKRALAAMLGGLVTLFVNPFLTSRNLPPVDDATLTGFVGIVVAFILQSGASSAVGKLAEAKATAAAAAVTPANAPAIITAAASEPAPPAAP